MTEGIYNTILVPIDGSEYSKKSLKKAVSFAKMNNCKLLVMNVTEKSIHYGIQYQRAAQYIHEVLKEESKEIIEDAKTIVNTLDQDIEVEYKIYDGLPASTILDVSIKENVDLIIIGTAGRTGVDRFLIGSITEKIIKSSAIDVLVIH